MYLHGSKFKRHKRIFIEGPLFTHVSQPLPSAPFHFLETSSTDSLGVLPEKLYAASTTCAPRDVDALCTGDPLMNYICGMNFLCCGCTLYFQTVQTSEWLSGFHRRARHGGRVALGQKVVGGWCADKRCHAATHVLRWFLRDHL